MTDFYLKTVSVKNDFAQIEGAILDDLEKALYLEAELIMTTSKRDYVPVVTGNLRNSGTVKRPVRNGDKIEVELGYGGSAAPYAAIVHEYPKTIGQGKNKYLSQPLAVSSKNMAARVAKHIRNAITRRGRGVY
ncbi:MAG: hypothetical protein EBU84_12390 [Actinobacteria bacterium]|nr:hypothetical protein [Actinomycetota bacterium]